MPRCRRHVWASPAQGGFSLIELLVVLVILALASTVITVAFNQQGEKRQLEAMSAALADDLRLARTRAEWDGRSQSVGFDPDARVFLSNDGRKIDIPDRFRVEFIASERAGPARILFHPDGSSSGGTVNLIGARLMTRTRVDWLTGAVDQSTEEATES